MTEINITYATADGITAIVKETAAAFRQGKIVVFPTETVYGIGCLMKDAAAVEKVYTIKGREKNKPLPIMVDCTDNIVKAAYSVPMLKKLEGRYMPGPLTVILKKKSWVSDIISAGLDTVAVRIPDHPFLLAVLKELGEPIVATSANLSGHPAPSAYGMLEERIRKTADLGIDSGPCAVGQASTIIDLTAEKVTVLRQGALTLNEIIAADE